VVGEEGRIAADDAAARIAELLSMTNRQVRRLAERELGPLGVTPSQLTALRTLSAGPRRISDIAARLGIVPRSATSVVDELEAAGLVHRRPDPDDRRAILAALTDQGAGLLEALRARRRAGLAELLDRLDPAEQAELIRLLARLSEG
jgi:DNA-binding MarR family transcriptional regulator